MKNGRNQGEIKKEGENVSTSKRKEILHKDLKGTKHIKNLMNFGERRTKSMYYEEIVFFDNNEFCFIEDVSLNINNALAENQEIPNKNLVTTTRELIEQHCIDFEEFMNMLKNNKSNYVMWQINGFDEIFEMSMVSEIEKVLFETHKQLLKETEEE